MVDLNVKPQSVNPRTVLVKEHTIPVTVKKIYTDVDGVIIDKAILPAGLQTQIPVFLLGEFDRMGGYKIGNQTVRVNPNWKYLLSFVNGNGTGAHNVVGFTGLATIYNELLTGDIIVVYTDSLTAPSYFCWIIVQNNYASIASIIGNLESSQNDRRIGPIVIHEINYTSDNEDQFKQGIFILHYANIGTWRQNSIDPLGMYRSPYDVQEQLIRIPIKPLFLDQYTGFAFQMIFDCDKLQMDFKIKTY